MRYRILHNILHLKHVGRFDFSTKLYNRTFERLFLLERLSMVKGDSVNGIETKTKSNALPVYINELIKNLKLDYGFSLKAK